MNAEIFRGGWGIVECMRLVSSPLPRPLMANERGVSTESYLLALLPAGSTLSDTMASRVN